MAPLAPRNALVARLSSGATRFTSLTTGSKIALGFLLLIILAAIFAPILAPHSPLASGVPAEKPNADNLFGTDRLGRDIFSRLLYGARSSLVIGLGSVALALLLGGLLGSLAATSAKWANEVIMRIMDMLMAFPGIALAAALLASLGNSIPVIVVASVEFAKGIQEGDAFAKGKAEAYELAAFTVEMHLESTPGKPGNKQKVVDFFKKQSFEFNVKAHRESDLYAKGKAEAYELAAFEVERNIFN